MGRGWFVLAGLLLAGCAAKPETTSTPHEPPPAVADTQTTDDVLLEQFRSGQFQLSAAVESLSAALSASKEIAVSVKGDQADVMKEIITSIDSAGEGVAEDAGDPPSIDEIKKDHAGFIAKRQKMIDDTNDALHDARDAEAAANEMTQTGPAALRQRFKDLDQTLLQAIDDLRGALQSLGGKEDIEPASADPGNGDQAPATTSRG